jgi:hypothetical protein
LSFLRRIVTPETPLSGAGIQGFSTAVEAEVRRGGKMEDRRRKTEDRGRRHSAEIIHHESSIQGLPATDYRFSSARATR